MRCLTLIALLLALTTHAQPLVDDLLAKMTLEEKVGQLTQYVPDQPEFKPALEKGLVGSILNGGNAKQTNELQRAAIAGSRLKIPLLIGHDVIHGYRTMFPINLAIAATWDPELAELSARIGAKEARAAGIRWTFAPMVDIARDPRWGRIAEGAGEDPFLGAAMAAAYVRGYQTNVLACAKHFAAYGAPEGGRDYGAAEMSEATLREVYLAPFKAAVDAGAASLMSGFNSLNGVPASANRHLLQDVLRRDWLFDGFVVSDWASVAELMNHGIAATPQDAAIAAVTAGVDMNMQDGSYATLVAAVRSGRIAEAVIDRAVRRVLRAKIAAGLFDDPFVDEAQTAKVTLTPGARDAARKVAQRAIVLLKNDGDVLPLSKSKGTIAVIGALAESKADMLGPWPADGKAEETVSALEGLRAAKPDLLYAKGDTIADALETAKRADVVIAVLGETRDLSGEAASRSSLDLPGSQPQLLEALVATGKPVVLVVMSGRPLSITWAAAHVPAIVQTWFLGSEGGHAIADVLFGDVNPSGKLPVSVPRTVGQIPFHYSRLRVGRPADPESKWTNKYLDLPSEPLYPFGYGLSYSKIEYSDVTITNEPLTASITLHNTGTRAALETVQMYISDVVASVARPIRELKGFQRVALAPGERKRVDFPITRDLLTFWLNDRWVTEPGTFKVKIGPDSSRGSEKAFELQ